MRRIGIGPVLATALALAACTQFPELDQTATPGVAEAPYPTLLPLGELLTGPAPRATPEVRAGVEARAAGLQARAAALQRARIGPAGDIDQRVKRLRQKAAALRNAQ